jgi:thymidylate synthase (FAD)
VRAVEEGARKIDYRYQGLNEEVSLEFIDSLERFHQTAYVEYEHMLGIGVAPEQARYFLPNTFFTEMIWTVNCRSLMNFVSLRNESHAMWEMREYAAQVEFFFEEQMPETYLAFLRNGRKAP